MQEPRHSQAVVWVCIGMLSTSVVCAQAVLAVRRVLHHSMPGSPVSAAEPPRIAEEPTRVPAFDAAPVLDASQGSTADWFLEAIMQVESAGNPSCVGLAGERGLMQIKEGTWSDTTRRVYGMPIPFSRAFEPDLNKEVGQAYLAYLAEFLRANQSRWQSDLRSLLAASYNAGPTRVLESGFDVCTLPVSTREYVERVSALHDYFLHDSGIAPANWFVQSADPDDRDS